MAISRRVMLLVVACTLVVLFIGSAEAGKYDCKDGYKDCDYDKKNGCETNVWKDVHNCRYCGNECKVTWGEYAEAYCDHGNCKQRCKYGYEFDYHKKRCVKKHGH